MAPEGSPARLKVSGLPSEVFEVGWTLWLEFDPQQMARIVE